MACNKCGRGKCRCKKVTIFDDRPEVIKVNTIPVPGEQGEQGPAGNVQVSLYANNSSDTIPPSITQIPSPPGWGLPTPLSAGEFRWKVVGVLSADGSLLIEPWSTPVVEVTNVNPFSPEDADEVFNL